MISWLCGLLWVLSEEIGIPLGRFAPYVFGGMIGRWPRKSCDIEGT